MPYADRHAFDKSLLRKEHEEKGEGLDEVIASLIERNRWGRLHHRLTQLCYTSAVLEPAAILAKHVRRWAAAAAAHFTLAGQEDGRGTVTFDGAEHDAVIDDPGFHLNPTAWLEAYAAATLMADASALEAILACGSDVLRRGNVKGAAYQYATVDFIRGVHAGTPGQAKALLGAMSLISADGLSGVSYDIALRLWGPQLDLWKTIISDDAKVFEATMVEAIDHHRGFWGRDGGFNQGGQAFRDHADGLTSFPLTALVQTARNQGLVVACESDYLVGSLLAS